MALVSLHLYIVMRPPRCYYWLWNLRRQIDSVQTTCFNQETGVPFPAGLRYFLSSPKRPTFCGLYLAFYPLDIGSYLPGLKRSKPEGNALPPSSVEVKIVWTYSFMAWCLVKHGSVTVIFYSVSVSSNGITFLPNFVTWVHCFKSWNREGDPHRQLDDLLSLFFLKDGKLSLNKTPLARMKLYCCEVTCPDRSASH